MNNKGLTVLAGDIGGTKTNLAVFSSESGLQSPLAEGTFPSGEYPDLESIVREFLSQDGKGININYASFGVAGPIVDGRAKITNLPWVMDQENLTRIFGFSSVRLLNDLMACACALPFLEANDLYTLSEGISDPEGTIAIVAPGTGLGEAYLTWNNTHYQAHASEGGHTDFAPTNALEAGLLNYLWRRFDHVSTELVCSGSGLMNIYNYLKDSRYAAEPGWLAAELRVVNDPVPVIIRVAVDADHSCRLCQSALDVFIHILGAEAGNMALKVMASGGVYLGGGIPPRIIAALQKGSFMDAFRYKGRMSELLERMPVRVIMNPRAALLGAARYAMNLAGKTEFFDISAAAK
ncbi:MAG: glucokinase [Smithella sp.]